MYIDFPLTNYSVHKEVLGSLWKLVHPLTQEYYAQSDNQTQLLHLSTRESDTYVRILVQHVLARRPLEQPLGFSFFLVPFPTGNC